VQKRGESTLHKYFQSTVKDRGVDYVMPSLRTRIKLGHTRATRNFYAIEKGHPLVVNVTELCEVYKLSGRSKTPGDRAKFYYPH